MDEVQAESVRLIDDGTESVTKLDALDCVPWSIRRVGCG